MRKILNWIRKIQILDFVGTAIVGIGIFLRLWQYLVNRSLWVDEASLALNIIHRTFNSLLLPLDYDQGAPIGFLFIEKAFSLILGNHEYALRLFPLLSGIFAIYLVYCIARIWLGKFGMFAILLFVFSDWMIYYSSELKQYSSDIMISLLLVYIALLFIRKKEILIQDIFLLGSVGFLSIWISHPSIFILPCIGFLLLTERFFKKEYIKVYWLLGMNIFWAVTFLVIYFISLNDLVGNENLQKYWNNNFAPFPTLENISWYKNIIILLLPHISPSFLPKIIPNINQTYLIQSCLALVLIGCLSLFFRNKKIAILTISPLLLAFLASIMRQYPISERFLYFWFPFLLFFMAEGLRQIYLICQKFSPKIAVFTYTLLVLMFLWTPLETAYHNFLSPHLGEDIKPVLAYIQTHLQPDDIIYVHHGSITPFLYYASNYGLDVDNTFVAKKSWNFKRFTIDVINFQGNDRVWLIFSHVIYCDCDGGSRAERVQAHIEVLDEHGFQLDYFEAERASTYLYNLNP